MSPLLFSRRPGDWSTQRGPTPGVRLRRRGWEACFPCGLLRWVYLGHYRSQFDASRAAAKARALPLAMRRRLAQCRPAWRRRLLLERMVREHQSGAHP